MPRLSKKSHFTTKVTKDAQRTQTYIIDYVLFVTFVFPFESFPEKSGQAVVKNYHYLDDLITIKNILPWV
jgi:hypothetical protein